MIYRFAEIFWFQLLWVLLVLGIVGYIVQKRQQKKIARFFGISMAPFLTSSVSLMRRRWKLFMELGALTFFIFALARPQSGSSQQKVKSEGIEIVLLFDVSNSMEAEDIKPSRLDLAKKEVNRFLDLLSGDRVGLVAFARSAILLSPVTPDISALRMYIESLTTKSVSSQGTEFSRALKEAKEAFRRGGVEGGDETAVTRAILIISDGEDQEPGALKIAEQLADEGIRIFSLAVGTEKGGPIPVRDEFGNLKGYHQDSQGKVVVSKTQGLPLQELARVGKGSFYQASYGNDAARSLFKDMKQLEQSQFGSSLLTVYDEKYQYFLIPGLLLIIIEMLISERKRKGRIWRGRFEVSPS